MISLIVLSMTRLEVSVDSLRARLDRAFPGEFLPPRDQGTFVVGGPIDGAQFLINSAIAGATGTFMLNSVAGPYTEVSDFAAHITDRALRELATAQAAWLSIDSISGGDPRASYRFIATAIGELAPADAAVIVDDDTHSVLRFNGDIRRQMTDGVKII